MSHVRRLLFLGEGSSDRGIMTHVERIARECGVQAVPTHPDPEQLELIVRQEKIGNGRTIAGRLRALKKLGAEFDLLVIHRDVDRATREDRLAEIEDAVNEVMPGVPWVPVLPCRMTEAWLVLDEQLIREIAGNPNGRVRLDIPAPSRVERIADPKKLLEKLLATAAELTGRKRESFVARFGNHRRLLLERLNPHGPVSQVPSWQAFDRDVRRALQSL